jgi:hypothetical protein
VGSHHHKLPFRFELTSYILVDENEAFLRISPVRPKVRSVSSFFIIADGIGSPEKKDRILLAPINGCVNLRVKLDPVPHGNHVFCFCVVFWDIEVLADTKAGEQEKHHSPKEEQAACFLFQSFHTQPPIMAFTAGLFRQ